MQPYNSRPGNWKACKIKTRKINFRLFGSTHRNNTKKRIIRWGKRAARKQAKEEITKEIQGIYK